MILVILTEGNQIAVQCAERTYLLSVGEDDTLYIEEEGLLPLNILISDEDNDLTIQGQWVNISLREEK